MKSLLHSLADSESVLLMYLFDELPDEDRADVESMLSTDHGLRARLDELRAIHAGATQALADADESSKTQARSLHSARRNAVRLVNQYTVKKTIDQPRPREVSLVRKYVLYPSMSVAAVMMLGLILWGMFGPAPNPVLPGEAQLPTLDEERVQLAELQRSLLPFESPEEQLLPAVDLATDEMLVRSLDSSDEVIRDAVQHRHIHDAESQIAVIYRLAQDPDF
jgi:anti-sigma factor RsiW